MRPILFLLTLCQFYTIQNLAIGQEMVLGYPEFTTYTISEYDSGPINYDIQVDSDNNIFFGNTFGLLIKNGLKWHTFYTKEKTTIYSLLVHPDKRIYTGSQNTLGFFSLNSQNYYEYHSLEHLLNKQKEDIGIIRSIYNTSYGILFVAEKTLLVYKNNAIVYIPIENFVQNSMVFYHDVLYASDNKKGLYLFDGHSFKYLNRSQLLAGKTIVGVHSYFGNNELLITNHGEFYLVNGEKVSPLNLKITKILKNVEVLKTIKLVNEQLVIATRNKGIIILDNDYNLIYHINRKRGLSSNTILSIKQDNQNNLWVGHNNGITKIDLNSPFTFIKEGLEVLGNGHCSVLYRDKIYLGTNLGLYFRSIHPKITDIKSDNLQFKKTKLSYKDVLSLTPFNDIVLIGVENGLYSLSGNTIKKISNINGVWKILKHPLDENKLFLGAYDGVYLIEIIQNKIKKELKFNDFEEPARVMEFDGNNRLWVTHGLKGVFGIDFNSSMNDIKKVNFYDKSDGLPSNFHINVFKIGRKLYFTTKKGIYYFDHASHVFKLSNDFEKDFRNLDLGMILPGKSDHVFYWASQHAGILEKINGIYHKKDIGYFNLIHQYINDGIIDYHLLKNGDLMIGANQGFIHYNRKNNYIQQEHLKSWVTKITAITNDSVLLDNQFYKNELINITLPITYNSLKFEVGTLYHGKENAIRYVYQLGDKRKPNKLESTNKEITFYNLKEGLHTLKIIAITKEGLESKSIVIHINILPPWWNTTTAYICYFILFNLIIIFIIFINKKRFNKKQLARSIAEDLKLKEKESEFERVKKIKEEAIVKLQNEKLHDEINFKNKELASSTFHIQNKNQLLNHIKNELEKTIRLNNTEKQMGLVKSLINEISHSIKSQSDWEQFEIHFNTVHGEFLSRIRTEFPDLSAQDMKIVTFLRLNLSSKEMAELLHISQSGIEKSRYRLRKKLNLEKRANLSEFILNY